MGNELAQTEPELPDTNETVFSGDVAVLDRLMKERGFRVSCGTYHHPDGDELPTWDIDRPDSPDWTGVWLPWERIAQMPEDGEVQTLLELCGRAIAKWEADLSIFDAAQNVE